MSTTKPGWFMPQHVLSNPDLTALEKLVMGVIVCLEEIDGCKCGNAYIAQQIGSTTGSVRNVVAALRAKGILEPNEVVFGKPFIGARLVPSPNLRVTNPALPVTKTALRVTKRDADTINTIDTKERETEAFKTSEFPDRNRLAESLSGTGFSRAAILDAYDQQLKVKLATPGAASAVRDWPSYVLSCLKKDRRASAPRSWAPPAPVSQFSSP